MATPQWREDVARAESALRDGSKSFHAASRLLPRWMRERAVVLYAFCRASDDEVDHAEGDAAMRQSVAALRERLARIYDSPNECLAVDRAMATLVLHTNLPRAFPEALIDGFAWDAESRKYATFHALEMYCVRVAGTVGLMMAWLMGVRSKAALAHACNMGIAMQLTNIARDVGEDARAGRLYLPLEWLYEANVDPEAWLREPVYTEGLARTIARLVDEAHRVYEQSSAGIGALPRSCRMSIRAARFIYEDIGRRIAAQNYDSVSRRAIVPRWRKLWLVLRSISETPKERTVLALPNSYTNFARALGPGAQLIELCSNTQG